MFPFRQFPPRTHEMIAKANFVTDSHLQIGRKKFVHNHIVFGPSGRGIAEKLEARERRAGQFEHIQTGDGGIHRIADPLAGIVNERIPNFIGEIDHLGRGHQSEFFGGLLCGGNKRIFKDHLIGFQDDPPDRFVVGQSEIEV